MKHIHTICKINAGMYKHSNQNILIGKQNNSSDYNDSDYQIQVEELLNMQIHGQN